MSGMWAETAEKQGRTASCSLVWGNWEGDGKGDEKQRTSRQLEGEMREEREEREEGGRGGREKRREWRLGILGNNYRLLPAR